MSLVLYVVRVEVAPSAADEWLAWQTDHHMPEVVGQPGFVTGHRYRVGVAPDGWIRFANLYEVRSRAALDAYAASEAGKRLKQEHLDKFGNVTRIEREIWDAA